MLTASARSTRFIASGSSRPRTAWMRASPSITRHVAALDYRVLASSKAEVRCTNKHLHWKFFVLGSVLLEAR